MNRLYKLAFFIMMFSLSGTAQELNCIVKVNYDPITDANPQVFKTLEKSLTEFVNNTKWTNKEFARNERIDCSMVINITSYNSTQFGATIQVQSSRPVYNSTYTSPVLNVNDKDFSFRYTEYENLYFNPNSFDSNLVSVVAFYANIIIGLDGDTYQKEGGSTALQTALSIANMAQQSGYKGWTQMDGNQNRYFLINDMLSGTFKSFREGLYEYHFLGLDTMSENQKEGKEKLVSAIKTISKVHSARPNAFLTRVFFDAKSDEVVSVFSGGPRINSTELVDILNRISPINATKWNNIR